MVLYEPRLAIFHTEDREVWELANAMTPFNDYRHRVDIVVEGKVLNWPILLSDIDAQSRSDEIREQLREREGLDAAAARRRNFEEVVPRPDGPDPLRALRPYTEKQWGRSARELSARWAPRRVSVRWDDDPYLFGDPYQGWPAGPNGYTDLIDGLLAGDGISVRPGTDVTLEDVDEHARSVDAVAVVLTCPLDVFCGQRFGALGWRGIHVASVPVPHVDHAQGAMVVNYPGFEYPFIRIHETKHALRASSARGPSWASSSPTRRAATTPSSERNRALNDRYQSHVREQIGAERVFFAGRLANYLYIDMDDCMRQALDVAEGEVLRRCARAAACRGPRRIPG